MSSNILILLHETHDDFSWAQELDDKILDFEHFGLRTVGEELWM